MAEWERSLEHLVRERGTALLRYGYLLCGHQSEAEDLVQEALIRTFVRGSKAVDAATAEAYVRRAMLNGYIDNVRRRRRWAGIRHLVSAGEVSVGPEDLSADAMLIEAALAALSSRQRACVVLRFYEDLTIRSIAEQLALSEGTVKRYLSDGLSRLAGALGTDLGDTTLTDEAELDIFTDWRTR
ncbi:MAG TPA: sigma-70 family RNA polymerase sigma factor [Propionicimonas sp.]